MGVEANSPRGRVRAAERAYASGEISNREYQRIARENGYTPARAQEVRDMYNRNNRRRPRG